MTLSSGGGFVRSPERRAASPSLRTALLSRTPSLIRDAVIAFLSLLSILAIALPARADTELLNVSYDPTRELYRALNAAFTAKHKDGGALTIRQSHGGSGTQARAIVDGLDADVATLAMWSDTNAIAKAGLMAADWEKRLPNDSLPYTSTIVFVVRKGNPKGIKDWPDIVKPGVEIVTPNPKTSGNGKLSFLAAWGSVTERGGSQADALDFVRKLYEQTPVLDLGARAATTTFVQKRVGEKVTRGDTLVTVLARSQEEASRMGDEVTRAYTIDAASPTPRPLVRHLVTRDHVTPWQGSRTWSDLDLSGLRNP